MCSTLIASILLTRASWIMNLFFYLQSSSMKPLFILENVEDSNSRRGIRRAGQLSWNRRVQSYYSWIRSFTLHRLRNSRPSWFLQDISVLSFHSSPWQTNLPVFKLKDSKVRRRYSDFAWLREELERESKVRRDRWCLRWTIDHKPSFRLQSLSCQAKPLGASFHSWQRKMVCLVP